VTLVASVFSRQQFQLPVRKEKLQSPVSAQMGTGVPYFNKDFFSFSNDFPDNNLQIWEGFEPFQGMGFHFSPIVEL
jgi:hypothetical protein